MAKQSHSPSANNMRQDKYGRTVADVLVPDGTNVNDELVKDG